MYPGDLSLIGSVCWLIDRTAEEKRVLGSAWKVRDDAVVTSASLLLPFIDHPEALAIEFPITKERYGVSRFFFHQNFDRWMGKRNIQESGFYPNMKLASQAYNVAGIQLEDKIKPLNRDSLSKLKNSIVFNKLSEEPDLTGQADNMQVTSILQTLMNARNIGTMMLIDDEDKILAKFCLADQKITHIQYQNLYNEQALNKLICTLEGELKFHFKREIDPEWANFAPIESSTAAMLMKAYSVLEESTNLYKAVGGNTVEIRRIKDELSLQGLTEEQCPPVACVWNHIKFPVSIRRVEKSCSFDGATVLNSLKFLVDTGQAQIGSFDLPPIEESKPFPLTKELGLSKGMEVYCFSIDPATEKGTVDMGYILDPVEDSECQILHTIGVPLSACGSPIILNNKVIGIHTSPLVYGFEDYKEWIHPGIMVTAESIYECMNIKKPSQLTTSQRVEAIDLDSVSKESIKSTAVFESVEQENKEAIDDTAGSIEATIEEKALGALSDAPHKEAMSEVENKTDSAQETNQLDEAPQENSILPDHENLLDDPANTKTRELAPFNIQQAKEETETETKPKKDKDKLSGFFKSVAGMLSGIGGSGEGLEVALYRQSLDSSKYSKVEANTKLLIGDFIQLKIKSNSDCEMTVLFQAGPEQPVEFLYPQDGESGAVTKGQHISIPTNSISMVSAGVMQTYTGFPLNFAEQESEIVVLFSFNNNLHSIYDDPESLKTLAIINAIKSEKNLEFKKFNLNGSTVEKSSNDSLDRSESDTLFACHLSIKQ